MTKWDLICGIASIVYPFFLFWIGLIMEPIMEISVTLGLILLLIGPLLGVVGVFLSRRANHINRAFTLSIVGIILNIIIILGMLFMAYAKNQF